MYVFEIWRLLFDERRDRSLYVGAAFVAQWFQHEYIRAVMASRSLWSLFILCCCNILSNMYTRYTEVICQCKLVQERYAFTYLIVVKLQLVS
jgi:hypothetical protein